MKKYFTSILAFLFLINTVHSQDAKRIAKFGFITLTGGTVIIKAKFDNFSDTLNFVFDTGSGGISLDSTTAENFGLSPEKTDKVIKGIAGIKPLNFLYNHTLKIGGLIVENLDFHINNYDILTNAHGVKIDGIIGSSFIKRYIVKVDYNNNIMEIFEPGFIKYPKRGFLVRPNFKSLPTVNAVISDNNTNTTNLIFDSGAGLCALLTEEFTTDSNTLKSKTRKFETQAEGLGGKKPMQITVVKKIQIGPYKFRLVPTYVFKDEFNVINYPTNTGVIGNEILKRFNLIINYPNGEIHLKPNTHFFDDFDYSYSGLGLYQINGQIRIEDIMPNSPAEKAGLKIDDLVIAIDNNFSQNMQAYKAVLQNAGNTLKILILRNGELLTINLQVASILKN